MLAFPGAITALPMILFSHATRPLDLATAGLMQDLNPTPQLLCAVVIPADGIGDPFRLGAAPGPQGDAWTGLMPLRVCTALANRIKAV